MGILADSLGLTSRDAHCVLCFRPWPHLAVEGRHLSPQRPRVSSPIALLAAADSSCSPRSWASPLYPHSGTYVWGAPSTCVLWVWGL